MSLDINKLTILAINFFKNLGSYGIKSFSDLGIPFIVGLGLLNLMKTTEDKSLASFKNLYLILVLANVFIISFIFIYLPRMLVPLIPILILFSADEINTIIKQNLSKNKNYPKTIFLIFIFMLSVLSTPAKVFAKYYNQNELKKNHYQLLSTKMHKYFNKNDKIVSNNNSILGWNGDVKAITFPHNVIDINKIEKIQKIDGIYLDSEGMKIWNIHHDDEWRKILNNQPDKLLDTYKKVEAENSLNFKYIIYKKI